MEFHQHLWRQKTGVPGLLRGFVSVMLAVLTTDQDLLQTDRTDRQTKDHSIDRASIALCSKNCNKSISTSAFFLCLTGMYGT